MANKEALVPWTQPVPGVTPSAPKPATTTTPRLAIDNVLSQDPIRELQQQNQRLQQMGAERAAESKTQREHLRSVIDEPTPDFPRLTLPAKPQRGNVDLMQAFGQPAAIIAIFGSLLTRRPMTAAINAAAAAMQGYAQGNAEAVKRAEQDWRDNLEIALRQNETEVNRYRAAMDKHQGDVNAAIAEIQASAAEFHDQVAVQNAQSGNISAIAQITSARASQAITMQNHLDMMQYRRDQLEATTAYREQQMDLQRDKLSLAKDRLGQLKEFQAAQTALSGGRLDVAKGQLALGERRLSADVTYHQQQMAQKQQQLDSLEKARTATNQVQRDRLKEDIRYHDAQIVQRQEQLKSLTEYRDTMVDLAQTRVTDTEAYRKAQIDLSRERLDVQKGKTAATAEAKVGDLQSLSDQIGSLTAQVESDPSLVGLKGMGRRWLGRIGGQVSSDLQDPKASRFEGDVLSLQAKLVKPFLDAHYFSGPAATRLDELVAGLGASDDPATVLEHFYSIKELIDGQIDTISAAARDVKSNALYPNAPPVGTVDGDYTFQGGDPTDPNNWSQ